MKNLTFCIAILLASLAARCQCHCAEPSGEVRLTFDKLFKRDPCFVNEGKELVFVVLSRPEQLQIQRMKLSDRKAVPIHKDEVRSELEPAFSRDGRYYAHLQSRSPASVALVIWNAKEKKSVEIPPAPGFSGMRSPAFSADGKRILYAFPEGGRQQIFSVDLQAKDRRTIIDSSGLNNWPHASADGKSLVFGSTRDGNFEIYVSRIDGSDVRRVTNNPSQEIRPQFSPDGKRIALTSNRDGNYEIYVMDVDGGNVRRLTNNPEKDDYAAWHPNGEQLVYVSERMGRQDLYLISAD